MVPTEFISAFSGASAEPCRHFRPEKSHLVFRKKPFFPRIRLSQPLPGPELQGRCKGLLHFYRSIPTTARYPEEVRRQPGAGPGGIGCRKIARDRRSRERFPAPGSIGSHFRPRGGPRRGIPALSFRKIAHTFKEEFILDSKRHNLNVSTPELQGHCKAVQSGQRKERGKGTSPKDAPLLPDNGITSCGRSPAEAMIKGMCGNAGPIRGGASS